jgi:hypothetical protein
MESHPIKSSHLHFNKISHSKMVILSLESEHQNLAFLRPIDLQVGHGAASFEAAKACLSNWAHFQLGWAIVHASTGTSPGSPVVVEAKPIPLAPLWVACPLRVVYALLLQDFLPTVLAPPKQPAAYSFVCNTLVIACCICNFIETACWSWTTSCQSTPSSSPSGMQAPWGFLCDFVVNCSLVDIAAQATVHFNVSVVQ